MSSGVNKDDLENTAAEDDSQRAELPGEMPATGGAAATSTTAPRMPLPTIEKFLPHPGEPPVPFKQWHKIFQRFLVMLNDARPATERLTAAQQNNYMYMMLGAEGCRVFDANPMSEQIDTATYEDVAAAVRDQFQPTTNEATAYFEFYRRDQGTQETTEEFLTILRTLAADCNFGTATDKQIAIRMVCGCANRETQTHLLALDQVDLPTVLKLMHAEEKARVNAAIMAKRRQPTLAMARNKPPRFQGPATSTDAGDRCSGCGRTGHRHKDSQCPAAQIDCRRCGSIGHFGRFCKSKEGGGRGGGRGGAANNTRGGASNRRPPRGRGAAAAKAVHNDSVSEEAILRVAKTGEKRILRTVEISNGRRFNYITMELDSGADPTTMTVSQHEMLCPNLPLTRPTNPLTNFDGTPIKGIKGVLETKIRSNGQVCRGLIHVVPDGHPTVLGKEFLKGLSIMIDCSELKVAKRDATTKKAPDKADNDLLEQFPRLLQPGIGHYPDSKHTIRVNKDAVPFAARIRPIPLARRDAVKAEVESMERDGVWEKIESSAWANPLVTVPKPDGGVRITTDLSKLNKFVVPDRHPLPNIKELLLEVSGAKIFSKIDLRKAYFNIDLDEASRELTATATPWGLYQYKRLPMGLVDAASAFQRRVAQTLQGIEGCLIYIDDILIVARDKAEHDARLEEVLRRLEAKNFRLNRAKCLFAVTTIDFLGHHLSTDGVAPGDKNVQALLRAKQPTNKKEVQAFLGLVNYYADFLSDMAELCEPLRRLTRQNEPFVWTEDCRLSFETLKTRAATKLKIYIFDPSAPTTVTTDASDVGVGGVLSQHQAGREVPIAFASRTLTKTERNYAANEKEALACVWAVEHWEKYLLGRHFLLQTDHQALESIFKEQGGGRTAKKFARYQQ